MSKDNSVMVRMDAAMKFKFKRACDRVGLQPAVMGNMLFNAYIEAFQKSVLMEGYMPSFPPKIVMVVQKEKIPVEQAKRQSE